MKDRTKNIIAVALLFALTIFFYGRLIYPEAQLIVTPDFGKSDSWHSSISSKMLLSEKLQKNQFPLWSQRIGSGIPVFAEGVIGAAYLPYLVIFRLTGPGTGISLMYILSAFTLASGMYVWLKSMGLSALPSLIGSLTITFSGITIPHLTHLALIPAQAMIPWIFWATRQLALKQSVRWTGILSAIIAQQILSGYPQAVFISLLFGVLYYLALQYKNISPRSLFLGFFVLVLAISGAAIQLLPTQEYLQQSTVASGYSVQQASFFSYPLTHLKTLIDPFALGNPKEGTYPSFLQFNGSIFWENSAYIGILPIVALIIYLLLLKHRTGNIHIFALGMVIAFLLMLGKFSPFYIVYSFWPFTLFRVPSRFVWVFAIALVVIFVHVAQKIWLRCKNPLLKSLFILLSVLHIIQLVTPWWNYHALGDASSWLTPPGTIEFLHPRDRVLSVGTETTHNRFFTNVGWTDIAPYYVLREALAPNSNITFGVDQHGAYIGRPLRRNTLADRILDDAIPQTQSGATVSAIGTKLLDIFSINVLVSSLPLSSNLLPVGSVKKDTIQIDTYRNPNALPKAYLAFGAVRIGSVEEAERTFASENFQPGKSVLAEETFTLSGMQGSAHIRTFSDDRVDISTEADGSAILVIAMTYYPGWRAEIDGVEAKTIPVNIRQTGVVVPGGSHVVKLAYRPESFKIGFFISVVSWTVMVLLILFPALFEARHTDPGQRVLSSDPKGNRDR